MSIKTLLLLLIYLFITIKSYFYFNKFKFIYTLYIYEQNMTHKINVKYLKVLEIIYMKILKV